MKEMLSNCLHTFAVYLQRPFRANYQVNISWNSAGHEPEICLRSRGTSFVSLMTILTCQTSEAVAAYKGSSIGLIDGQLLDRIHTAYVSALPQTPNSS